MRKKCIHSAGRERVPNRKSRCEGQKPTHNMKYKSGFKIEFRVLPLSRPSPFFALPPLVLAQPQYSTPASHYIPQPLLKYTLRVTSRRHQSIAKCCVVCCIFRRKKIIKERKKKKAKVAKDDEKKGARRV